MATTMWKVEWQQLVSILSDLVESCASLQKSKEQKKKFNMLIQKNVYCIKGNLQSMVIWTEN